MASKRPLEGDDRQKDPPKRPDRRASPSTGTRDKNLVDSYRPNQPSSSDRHEQDDKIEAQARQRQSLRDGAPSDLTFTGSSSGAHDTPKNYDPSHEKNEPTAPLPRPHPSSDVASPLDGSALGVSENGSAMPGRSPSTPSTTSKAATTSEPLPDIVSMLQNFSNAIIDITLQKAKIMDAEHVAEAAKQELEKSPNIPAYRQSLTTKHRNAQATVDALKPRMSAAEGAKEHSLRVFSDAWTSMSGRAEKNNRTISGRQDTLDKQNRNLRKLSPHILDLAEQTRDLRVLSSKVGNLESKVESRQAQDDAQLARTQKRSEWIAERQAKRDEDDDWRTGISAKVKDLEELSLKEASGGPLKTDVETLQAQVKDLQDLTSLQTERENAKAPVTNHAELVKAFQAVEERCTTLDTKIQGMKEYADVKDEEVAGEMDRLDSVVTSIHSSCAEAVSNNQANVVRLDEVSKQMRDIAASRQTELSATGQSSVQHAAVESELYASKGELTSFGQNLTSLGEHVTTLRQAQDHQVTKYEAMRKLMLAVQGRVNNMTTEEMVKSMLNEVATVTPLNTVQQHTTKIQSLETLVNEAQPMLRNIRLKQVPLRGEMNTAIHQAEIRLGTDIKFLQGRADQNNPERNGVWFKINDLLRTQQEYKDYLHRKINEWFSQISAHNDRLNNLARKLVALEEQCQVLGGIGARVEKLETHAESESALEVFKACGNAKAGIRECKQHISNLQQTLEEYKRRHEQLQEQLSATGDRTKSQEARIAEMQQQLDMIKQQSKVKQRGTVASPASTSQLGSRHNDGDSHTMVETRESEDVGGSKPGRIHRRGRISTQAVIEESSDDDDEAIEEAGDDTRPTSSRSSGFRDIDDELVKPSPVTSLATPRSPSNVASSRPASSSSANTQKKYSHDEQFARSILGPYSTCAAAIELYARMKTKGDCLSEPQLHEIRAIFADPKKGLAAVRDLEYTLRSCTTMTGRWGRIRLSGS